jgi:flavin-dependent dehydrogenase
MPGAPIDIAIIGAGIAGCAAALTLAGGARSVIVVAPPAVPAARIGEFLSPAANALLAELGLTADFAAGPHRQANATFSAWGSDLLAARNAIIHVEGPGHVLDRSAFEAMLRTAVAHRGVTTLGSAVTGADRADGAWSLRLSGGERMRARFLLDCSGRAAVVTRHLARRHHADRLVAAYGFLHQHDDSVVPTPATLIEAAPNGWWYASLLPDQRLALALFADPDTLPRGIAREMLVWRNSIATTTHIQRWAEDAGFAIEALPRLASAATTWLAPVAGTDWAAAGDAAAAFDPLSSHGLTTALWSGRRAAQAATSALLGDPAPLARYAATLEDAVQDFLRQRRGIYAHEHRWREQPFWQRRISDPHVD